jgi:hypothetical protein
MPSSMKPRAALHAAFAQELDRRADAHVVQRRGGCKTVQPLVQLLGSSVARIVALTAAGTFPNRLGESRVAIERPSV